MDGFGIKPRKARKIRLFKNETGRFLQPVMEKGSVIRLYADHIGVFEAIYRSGLFSRYNFSRFRLYILSGNEEMLLFFNPKVFSDMDNIICTTAILTLIVVIIICCKKSNQVIVVVFVHL